MAKAVRIIVEEDGYPREFLSQVDWRRAVSDGSLQQETEVTVYRDGAAPQYMRAREVAELESLFRPPEPSRELPPAEDPPPPPADAAPSAFAPAHPPMPSPEEEQAEVREALHHAPSAMVDAEPGDDHLYYRDEEPDDEELDDGDAWRPAMPEERPLPAGLVLVLAALAALVLIVWLSSAGNNRPVAAAERASQYRVTGTANVRTRPTTAGSQVVGQLHRDDVVIGIPRSSGDQVWIEISEGVNAGSFVWGRNLAVAP